MYAIRVIPATWMMDLLFDRLLDDQSAKTEDLTLSLLTSSYRSRSKDARVSKNSRGPD